MKNMIPLLLIGGAALLVSAIFEDDNSNEEIPQRRIFISHSWQKSSTEYHKFITKLKFGEVGHYNHSIPEENAFDATKRKELEEIFRGQIVNCSKIFVLATKGINSKSYVGLELQIAKELRKEIIAVKPHGQEDIPAFIKKYADFTISNNIKSIKKILKN